MERTSQFTIQVPQLKSSLEDTLKAFMHLTGQSFSDMKNATMANTSAIESLKGQLDRLVAKLNRMQEEELQSQLVVERHYMIDEDDSTNPHHEHVQATTTLGSEEVVEEIVNEPSLEDHLEESFAHLEFDLDLDMIHEQANTSSSAVEEEEKDEHLESFEHLEQTEPPSTLNLSNDKEVSTETHFFITISLETLHEPQDSILQCLKEPSYTKILKNLCTQGHKSGNHLPKKIIQSK
jgi:hypothetical protein